MAIKTFTPGQRGASKQESLHGQLLARTHRKRRHFHHGHFLHRPSTYLLNHQYWVIDEVREDEKEGVDHITTTKSRGTNVFYIHLAVVWEFFRFQNKTLRAPVVEFDPHVLALEKTHGPWLRLQTHLRTEQPDLTMEVSYYRVIKSNWYK